MEHNMSKDSASPSSVEQPEIVSAVSNSNTIGKYIKDNYWTNELNKEEEPELQSPPVISAVNHDLYFNGEPEESQLNNSEILNYSKDSTIPGL